MRKVDGVVGRDEIQPDERLISLDGLRGIAALIVVLSHIMLVRPSYWDFRFGNPPAPATLFDRIIFDSPLRLIFAGGGTAVILFFVLSGFVLMLPWANGRCPSYRTFLISRICRIYLPYFASMLLAGLLTFSIGGHPIPGASAWLNYSWTNHLSIFSAPSALLMLGNQFSTWINNPTWTLILEMRVSIIFPIIALLIMRWKIAGAICSALFLVTLYTLSQTVLSHFAQNEALLGSPQRTFYYAGFFLAGAILAEYRRTLVRIFSLGGGRYALCTCILALMISWVQWPTFADMAKGACAALLIISAISTGPPRHWLSSTFPQWLGKISYSLYLMHLPVILTAIYIFNNHLSAPAIAIMAFPAILLVSILFHYMIERPAHNLGRSMRRKMRSATIVAAA
jgi:peptidoglycan/LPS O-acetylase OafA/YrhL